MMARTHWLYLALVIAALSCTDNSDAKGPAPSSSPVASLSEAALGNAAYTLDSQLVKLTNGEFFSTRELAPGVTARDTVKLLPVRGAGELDGDSAPDSAVVVSYSGGGSGTFYYLVAVLNRAGDADPAGSISLGDRVVVHTVEVANRQITVKLRAHGPGDPLCCPSLEATRVYALNGRSLALVSKTD